MLDPNTRISYLEWISSPLGAATIEELKEATPPAPASTAGKHTYIVESARREGYMQAIRDLQELGNRTTQAEESNPLFDTRD